jgi:hypothetical protein
MEYLLLASAVLDCAAVAAIAWFVRRAGHDQDAVLASHWRTLDRLRADLVELVHAAEERGQALTAALNARDERLRALERAQLDAGPRADPPWPLHLGVDPAEARLLRNLERTLPGVPPRA